MSEHYTTDRPTHIASDDPIRSYPARAHQSSAQPARTLTKSPVHSSLLGLSARTQRGRRSANSDRSTTRSARVETTSGKARNENVLFVFVSIAYAERQRKGRTSVPSNFQTIEEESRIHFTRGGLDTWAIEAHRNRGKTTGSTRA